MPRYTERSQMSKNLIEIQSIKIILCVIKRREHA
jgi:hypothetical protein